jgi:hypothetical protein
MNDSPPFCATPGRLPALVENPEYALDEPDAPIRLGRRQPEASPSSRWPRADVLEFGDVLGRAAKLVAAREEDPDGLADPAVVWVVALEQPEQDVRVDEVGISRALGRCPRACRP